ncbi:hypothetical protein V8F33_009058 [Rhypophila sp. PSN 637]
MRMAGTRNKPGLPNKNKLLPSRLVRQNRNTPGRMDRPNPTEKPTHDRGQPGRLFRRSARLRLTKPYQISTTHPEPQRSEDSIPAELPELLRQTVLPTNKTKEQKWRYVASGPVAGCSFILEHSACLGCTPGLPGKDDVTEFDWCVGQIKHRHSSTGILANKLVTQYWHWIDEAKKNSQENIFEYQVRQYTQSNKETTWDTYKNLDDFNLRLAELTEVKFAVNSHKIIIGTKQIDGVTRRGDVLADFMCNHIKWRFLIFMANHGIGLAVTTAENIEEKWNRMNPEVLQWVNKDEA